MSTKPTHTFELAVDGMTCQSCVAQVRAALGKVTGVAQVDVTLRPGAARVVAETGVEVDQLIAAVRAAGYRAAPGSAAGLPVVTPGGSCCT